MPVRTSVTTSRIQGGGVIGLLSLSPNPHMRALFGCCTTTRVNFLLPSTREMLGGAGADDCCCVLLTVPLEVADCIGVGR